MTLAILSALADEQQGMLDELRNPVKVVRARRDFWRGKWFGQDVVLALCGIGKVAAATTASTLIESFGVQAIVLTGVAGGLAQGVAVGDVVVARAFLQHDMDASPLFVRYEVPMYGRKTFDCHAGLSRLLVLAAQNAASGFLPPISVHQGLIVSGDRFVSGAGESRRLVDDLLRVGLSPLAVEMEGAAVAQVCFDHGVDFAAVRTISDRADASAHQDFLSFVQSHAGPFARVMLGHFMVLRSDKSG